jgi:endonuclease/exonuclease/phosphatase family metal-dependent hydrolase
MRLLLYNIRYGTGSGGIFHLPWSGYFYATGNNLKKITEFIKSQKPDIVGLVEVDAGSYRSKGLNQAELIAGAIGHYHVFESKYSNPSFGRRMPVMNKQVNAILCNEIIRHQKAHYFDKGIKRLVIELELDNLVIFLVHLSLSFSTRHCQLGDLYALVKNTKKPCLVAGDFNAYNGDREMRLFLAATGLMNACPDGQPSYPSWSPKKQLDFIFHSQEIKINNFTVPRLTLSDHLPLVCDFTL